MSPSITQIPSFLGKRLLSIRDLSKEEILYLLEISKWIKEKKPCDLLKGRLMASCFFEPSTRTRLSFEAAMKRLGGDVIGFAEGKSSSLSKKESLHDTMKVIGQYADLIVIRHPLEGAARFSAEATNKPVINAGDGANQHPTQTLLDLYTMLEHTGSLDGLHVGFYGDLKYGRTVHSLVQALSLFNVRLYFIAAPGLELPVQLGDELKKKGVLFSFHANIKEAIPKLDFLYMTRVQEERLSDPYVGATEVLNLTLLQQAKSSMKILHPLPRVQEIDSLVDGSPFAHYFNQSENGLYVRQALLALILNGGV